MEIPTTTPIVRKTHTHTHTSTSDLLTWHSHPSSVPHNQPPRGTTRMLFGGHTTNEEAECLNRSVTFRKQCSKYKLKEMSGSSIFGVDGKGTTSESGMGFVSTNSRTSVRIVQQGTNGTSQISFSTEERVSPKRPTSVPEVAKQRELSGTLDNVTDSKAGKHVSTSKCKELSGNDIFGSPSEIPRRSKGAARSMGSKDRDMGEPAPRAVHTSVRVSNPAGGQSKILFGEEPVVKTTKKIINQEVAGLPGVGNAKLKEMNGNDIFADGKAESREHFAGVRKPPGGVSSIWLI